MDASITTQAVTPTGIVAPHPTSPAPLTTYATPQTGASLIPSTPMALHMKHNQEKPSNI